MWRQGTSMIEDAFLSSPRARNGSANGPSRIAASVLSHVAPSKCSLRGEREWMYHADMNERGGNSAVIRELLHTADAVQAHVESRLAAVGLSRPKLAALTAIREAGDSLPLSQLAERLLCVKSNITQLVDRLEADGFVKRASDPADRRARLAELTTAGRVACEAGARIQEEAERELLAAFTADDASRLKALVEKLQQSAR